MSHLTSLREVIAPEDVDRAVLYGFIGRMLQAAPSDADLTTIRNLESDDTALGGELAALSKAAAGSTPEGLSRIYQDLFIGVGRGELLPYGSYYLTGFLHEKPLADLRASMARFGIERSEGVSEPEDHIAALMQMMEGLIMGEFGQVATLEEQRKFFIEHIGSWAGHFFKDLAAIKSDPFYAAVGVLGTVFMAVEADAFAMTE
ncbi:TorD/DmsD family molecular chaperone [Roseibium algae]|uniref:Molecular chaperone TorD family protein n=1 Tax=Roseibium algae TaxID=3123038 RepID=A0ABU8TIZ9_9HYPH